MRLQPLSDRVILRRLPEETDSGLLIVSDKTKNKSPRAVVLAIGPGEKNKVGRRPMTVKVGDEVMLGQHPYYEFTFEGETLICAHEDDVAMIVPPKEAHEHPASESAQQAA